VGGGERMGAEMRHGDEPRDRHLGHGAVDGPGDVCGMWLVPW